VRIVDFQVSAAERELRVIVKDALGVLLKQPLPEGVDPRARIEAMVHEETTRFQERQVNRNQPLLPDPAASEQWLLNEIFGLAMLEPLMANPRITSIMVNSPTRIYVVVDGHTERAQGVWFDSDEQVREMVKRLAGAVGRRLDDASPRVDLTLPDGSRLHALMPPITRQYTEVLIRKFTHRGLRLPALVTEGSFGPDLARFLSVAVRAKVSLAVSGQTGAGKTTLLGGLVLEVDDPDERLIVLEETRELGVDVYTPNCLSWVARLPNADGLGAISIRSLLQEDALRMEPSRIIVGEVRGPESLDMLTAMNTGHQGSMSTIHANSARDALYRLVVAAMQAPERPSEEVLHRMIARCLQLVVQMKRLRDGRRVVTEVFEITGLEGGELTGHQLWAWQDGRLARTGLRPRCLEQIAEAEIPYDWSDAA